MGMVSVLLENGDSELKALSFNFPELLISKFNDLFSYLDHRIGVVCCNCVQDVDRVNSDLCALIAQSDKSVVQEHIKPLLVELFFLSQQVSLAGVDENVVL